MNDWVHPEAGAGFLCMLGGSRHALCLPVIAMAAQCYGCVWLGGAGTDTVRAYFLLSILPRSLHGLLHSYLLFKTLPDNVCTSASFPPVYSVELLTFCTYFLYICPSVISRRGLAIGHIFSHASFLHFFLSLHLIYSNRFFKRWMKSLHEKSFRLSISTFMPIMIHQVTIS